MDDIRFRAWIPETEKMGEVVAMDWNDSQIITCHIDINGTVDKYYPNYNGFGDAITFLRFTGLRDKDNKMIYEGDILRIITFGFDSEKMVTNVLYSNGQFRLANGRNMFYFGQSDMTKMDDAIVIGNIFENADLIVLKN